MPAEATSPQKVHGNRNVDDISVGVNHSLALLGTKVLGWGSDYSGQINGMFTAVETPTVVAMQDQPPPAKRVLAGWDISAVVGLDDTLTVWGLGFRGDGESSSGYSPAQVDVGTIIDVAIGSGVSEQQTICVITTARQVLCWGADTYGQVGNGDPVAETRTPQILEFEE